MPLHLFHFPWRGKAITSHFHNDAEWANPAEGKKEAFPFFHPQSLRKLDFEGVWEGGLRTAALKYKAALQDSDRQMQHMDVA